MEQPPPFFKRGPSPLARIAIFATLSILMMATDAQYGYLNTLRASLSLLINPLQRMANTPLELYQRVGGFFVTHALIQSENMDLREQKLQLSALTLRYQSLENENARLRKLLNARPRFGERAVVVEIFHGMRDPFSRKIAVDKGEYQNIKLGSAVIDDIGVVGQVTQVYPLSSEVTLLTDKDQAVPVQNQRTGQRGIVVGTGQGGILDLPFMPVNADIQNGDLWVTSGIDGTYPAGLPVAVVSKIERNAAYAFAKITCIPAAGVDRYKQLLIINMETPPAPAAKAHAAAPENPSAKAPNHAAP
jgi:rod shape-determining protein MreC